MYNYGDSVLVIEKDTDENFYVEKSEMGISY